jgi:hypothetical protein
MGLTSFEAALADNDAITSKKEITFFINTSFCFKIYLNYVIASISFVSLMILDIVPKVVRLTAPTYRDG